MLLQEKAEQRLTNGDKQRARVCEIFAVELCMTLIFGMGQDQM